MLGKEGVILPSPTTWYPSTLKFGLMYSEASEGRLSSEEVHPCLGPVGPRGVEVMVGVGSTVLLWDPTGLWRLSDALELIGMVMSSVQVSSACMSCHLWPLTWQRVC